MARSQPVCRRGQESRTRPASSPEFCTTRRSSIRLVERPYVLVVLTRGIPEQAVARQLIADISRLGLRARGRAAAQMIVAIGTDHAGFALKDTVVAAIRAAGHEVLDCGAFEVNPDDDYPDFAASVARAVIEGRAVARHPLVRQRRRRVGGGEQVCRHSIGALPRLLLGAPGCRGRLR